MVKDCLWFAKYHYYRQNFSKAEKFLLQCVAQNHSDITVFKYLGLVYVCRNDYENAKRALRRFERSADEEDAEVLNTLAFLKLKDNRIDQAVSYWLDVLKTDQENSLAKQNLDRIKNQKNKEHLYKTALPADYLFVKHFSVSDFFASHSLVIWIVISSLTVGLAVFLWLPSFQGHTKKSYLPSVVLEKNNDYIEENKKAMFRFSNRDVPYLFHKVKRLMKKGKYNKAVILINKVLHSNVKGLAKEKFLLLKDFVPVPADYSEVRNISLSDIINSPTIYKDCCLVIDGTVDKILKSSDTVKFRVLSKNGGSVVVFFPYSLSDLKLHENVRILGIFQYVQSPGNVVVVKGSKIWVKQEKFIEIQ